MPILKQISKISFLLISIFIVQGQKAAEKKVALVIGNSKYIHSTELKNPRNDAEKISKTLKRLGFEIVDGTDLTRENFIKKLRDFSKKLEGADVGLVFYAGHGLQVKGRNYLVPIDAKLQREEDLRDQAIDLKVDILDRLEGGGRANVNLVFLDACRNNPLAKKLFRSLVKSGRNVESNPKRGLAIAESGVNTLISFATAPDNIALDGAVLPLSVDTLRYSRGMERE